jgi:hypothetical protein
MKLRVARSAVLDRLSNRLTKIIAEAHKLGKP